MSKKRLGLFGAPLSAPRRLGAGEATNGSHRASLDFYSGIYRYGSFDEYHCFVPGDFRPCVLEDQRFVVVPFAKLKRFLTHNRYTAFHHFSPTLKTRVVRVRNRDSRNLFPITSTTHTISYAYMLRKSFAPYCVYPMHPFDAIFASSKAVSKTLSYYFEQISSFCTDALHHPGCSYPGRIPIIPLGIDYETLAQGKVARAQAKAELGFPGDSCVILWFGRISAGTKADLLPLLQAILFLRRSGIGNKCVLAIAGAGRDCQGPSLYSNRHRLLESYLSQMTPDNSIRFFHCPSDELKGKLYSAADVFVSLSDNIQESFGLTIVEAQAMGLPVIVSDWDGYKDIAIDGVTGFRVPTYWGRDSRIDELATYKKIECYHFRQAQSVAVDIPDFLSHLERLIKNEALRAKLGRQAQIHARQYYWPRIIKRYEQLWSELCEESANLVARRGIANLRVPSSRPSGPLSQLGKQRPKLSYYKAFSHFATHIVDDRWYVKMGRIRELLVDATSGNLSKELLCRILEVIERRGYDGAEIQIRDLIDDFVKADVPDQQADGSYCDEEIIRHIMWLFKQGVVHCFAELDGDSFNQYHEGLRLA